MKAKKSIYISYSIYFSAILLLATLPTQVKTGSFLGFGLFLDGLTQHLIFMQDYVESVKSAFANGLMTYRYDLGLGSDFFVSYTYYSLFDPITLIAYIIPIKYIEFSYYLMIVIRLYLSGIFIIFLAKKFNIKNYYSLLAVSIFYVFNVSVLYSAFRHPMFINGPMLFPLIILGAEKIINNKSPLLLVLISFYAIISQFYFFVFLSLGFLLFVVIRTIQLKMKSSLFLKINCLYALGALLGSFVLIPQIYAMIDGGRLGSKGFIIYGIIEYGGILGSYLIPVVGKHYTSGIGNVIVLFIILAFVFSKKNIKNNWELIMFLVITAMMLVSVFGYMINGFTYVNNRYSFLIILPAALLLGHAIENTNLIIQSAVDKALKTIVTITIIIAVCFLIGLFNNLFISGLVVIVFSTLLYFIFKLQTKLNYKRIITPQILSRAVIISSFVVCMIISISYGFFFTTSKGLDAYGDVNRYQIFDQDQEFYRVDQSTYVLNLQAFANDNLVYNYNSTYFYNSMSSKHIGEVIEYFNVVNHNNTVGYNGFNNRLALNTINHVKYIIIRESDRVGHPYGFELVDEVYVEKFINHYNPLGAGYIEYQNRDIVYEKAYIYQNKYFVDFGFVYNNHITKEELNNLSPIARENILLDAVILDSEIEFPKYNQVTQEQKYQLTEYILENIEIIDGVISVGADGGKISFNIPNVINSEIYLEITGIYSFDRYQSFSVEYYANQFLQTEHYYSYGTLFHINNPNHLVMCGYFDNESVDLEIVFPQGQYYYDEIAYYVNPMNNIEKKVSMFNSLENLQFHRDGFSGSISIDNDGFLFISLPYSSGFSAYVNGQESKIYQANIGYMGVLLESGVHDIEFVYQTPGMKLGLLISLLALLIVIVSFLIRTIVIYEKRNCKREEIKI